MVALLQRLRLSPRGHRCRRPEKTNDGLTEDPGEAATLVTGGEIHPQEGSGTIAFTSPSDAQVEAGTNLRTLALTYTASTAIGTVNLEIDVKGIVEVSGSADPDDDKALQANDDGEYGHVSGSDRDIVPVITDDDEDCHYHGC